MDRTSPPGGNEPGNNAAHDRGSTPIWDDSGFRERAKQAALKAGFRNLGDAMQKAGYDRQILDKNVKMGRNVGMILQFAKTVEANPAWLMGLREKQEEVEDDRQLGRLALVANIACHLYVALDSPRTIPRHIDSGKVVAAIMQAVDREFDG